MKKPEKYKFVYQPQTSRDIEWIYCPHCKKQLYGRSSLEASISWTSQTDTGIRTKIKGSTLKVKPRERKK